MVATLDLPEGFNVVLVQDLPQASLRLMKKVVNYARLSPDPSTQNAAVLTRGGLWFAEPVLETWAVNEFPEDVAYTPERWERPLKYSIIEHAERNAIFNAARHGVPTKGKWMVCPWAACADCARAIIQAGITHLLTLESLADDTNRRWDNSIAVAMQMLAEAGVEVSFIRGSLGCDLPVRRNGKEVLF